MTTTTTETACNKAGLTKADYTGKPSTLCKGCGHDSVTNAIIQAYFELGIKPFDVVKLSGIGCSSKTPAYFIDRGHGFNSVHGRMPSVATGAKLANHKLAAIGISGDGDTASIGLGQFCHLVRRNLDMTYVIENNGTYGLTKGQFSSTADQGSKSKKGVENVFPTIDCCELAMQLGATFVARSFSGDRKQMVSLLKAAHSHKGISVLDIISPCVTFNNHTGSTKSYLFVKDHDVPLQELGYVPVAETIEVEVKEGESTEIALHDGSTLVLKKLTSDFDPTDKIKVMAALDEAKKNQTVLTGLLYYAGEGNDLSELMNLTDTPLAHLTDEDLVPSPEALKKILSLMK